MDETNMQFIFKVTIDEIEYKDFITMSVISDSKQRAITKVKDMANQAINENQSCMDMDVELIEIHELID